MASVDIFSKEVNTCQLFSWTVIQLEARLSKVSAAKDTEPVVLVTYVGNIFLCFFRALK